MMLLLAKHFSCDGKTLYNWKCSCPLFEIFYTIVKRTLQNNC